MEPNLEIKNLVTEFKTPFGVIRSVDDISFSVNPGEIMGIVGESGCGKSVTSLSIMGLLPKGIGRVAEGSIKLKGREMTTLKERQLADIRGKELSMIFQEPMTSLNPVFKIGKQVMEPLRKHMGMTKKEARLKAIELFKEVGISRPEQIVDNYPHELSGGMLQRVMIAMGMACKPDVLIADEPTTALDVTVQSQILSLMEQLKKDNDTSILFITHNLGVVAELCDRVIVMYAGNIVEQATVKQLFENPCHPYTKGLMSCIPKINEEKERLDTINGMVPSPFQMPKGCRFSGRCKFATKECENVKPDLIEVEEGHMCRCHYL